MNKILKAIKILQGVNRFQCRDIIRQSPVIGHTGGVATIAYCLAQIDKLPENDIFIIIIRSLFHDFSEALIGDIPHEAKYSIPEFKEVVENSEKNFLIELCNDANLNIYTVIGTENKSWHDEYVKAADLIELLVYCGSEISKGNTNLKWTFERGINLIIDMVVKVPAIKRFIEETHNGKILTKPQTTFSNLTSGRP